MCDVPIVCGTWYVRMWYIVCPYVVRGMSVCGTWYVRMSVCGTWYVRMWYVVCPYVVRGMSVCGTWYVRMWYVVCPYVVHGMSVCALAFNMWPALVPWCRLPSQACYTYHAHARRPWCVLDPSCWAAGGEEVHPECLQSMLR